MVRSFIDVWEARQGVEPRFDSRGRRNVGGTHGAGGRFTGTRCISGVSELERRTGAPNIASPVPAAAIYRVLSAKSCTTELRIADALVAAIDLPEAFHNGTLPIQPNPAASAAARAACCGSSLTGSG